MKITILTYGSRGDVQPFLPLSLELAARGHAVTLAAPARFQDLVEAHAIPFAPLAGDPEELSRRLNDAGQSFVRMVSGMLAHAVEIGAQVARQTEEACRDADLIIHTFAHAVGAHTLAREKGVPDIHIQTFPMFAPTGDYPNVTLPDLRIPFLNRSTHLLSQKITWLTSRWGYAQVRRRAGAPHRKLYSPFDRSPARPPTPVLCAWSPRLIPPSADWPPHVHVTGWFYLDPSPEYSPPAELARFLESGPPPVCVSFGSMVNRDAEAIGRTVREALDRTKDRGIILSGWSQVVGPASDTLLYLDSVPHDWLLPRCKMVVHHGGAGTTSAGLRAGIPNVVVPFTADQPFWGRRLQAIGAGPGPIHVRKLSADRLARALTEADGEAVRRRARAIGRQIRQEEGTREAAGWIENYSNIFHRRR